MKKFFSILALFLFCSTWNSQAQQQTFNTPPKFKNVVQNDLNTKILSINSTTNKLEWVNKNSFVLPTPSFQDVLNVNENAYSFNGNPAFNILQGGNITTNFRAESIIFNDGTPNSNKQTWIGFDGFSSENNNSGKRVMLTTEDGLFLKTNITGFESKLKSNLLTANRDFEFPDKSGTLALEKPYTVYTALISQSGTNAPTVTLLENSANLTFTINRSFAGLYQLNLTSPTTLINKVFFTLESMQIFSGISITKEIIGSPNVVLFQINTKLNGTSTDGLLNNAPLEIRIYN